MILEELRVEFTREALEMLRHAESLVLSLERDLRGGVTPAGETWIELLGLLHTLKGNSSMMGYARAAEIAHAAEDHLEVARGEQREAAGALVAAVLESLDMLRGEVSTKDGEAPESVAVVLADVRVAAADLDRLLEIVGELSAHHGRLGALVGAMADRLASSDVGALEARDVVDYVGKTIAELRLRVTKSRLLPLSLAFDRTQRTVRDACARAGKEATLGIYGGNLVVDKAIVDVLGEPLLHVLRNAVDHGIEAPQLRLAAGKSRTGALTIDAATGGADLVVTVTDDGRGIDVRRLAEKAKARGIDVADWTREELLELVFEPSLSTSEGVTELSGRGIGLDAARRAIERFGGTLEVSSADGRGTVFHLRVPLAVTVHRSLIVACGGERFAIPVTQVAATFRIPRAALHVTEGQAFTRFRGRLLPVDDLRVRLGVRFDPELAPQCIVVEEGQRWRGVIVDGVVGQEDVVVKDLDPLCGRPPLVAGASLLSDGAVVMVLDPRSIAGTGRARGRAA